MLETEEPAVVPTVNGDGHKRGSRRVSIARRKVGETENGGGRRVGETYNGGKRKVGLQVQWGETENGGIRRVGSQVQWGETENGGGQRVGIASPMGAK